MAKVEQKGNYQKFLRSWNLGPSILARIAYFHVPHESVSDAVDVLHLTVQERTAVLVEHALVNLNQDTPVWLSTEGLGFDNRVDEAPLARPIRSHAIVSIDDPPSMALGHSTSGCIIESTASMSRALNAAYALRRSSRTSADIGWSYMFLRTCCSHGSVFTDRHSTCAPGSINMLNSLVFSYSPKCMEGVFCELRLLDILRRSHRVSKAGIMHPQGRHRARSTPYMSIFPTKILVATDGSREAELAFASAADLSQKTASELHVVYVGHMPASYESPGATTLDPNLHRRMQDGAQKEARTKLDEQLQQVGESGEVAESHARLGRPDAEIVGLADELGAGLIVLGSRGLGRLRRALMGSVSDSVIRHAHCPVLVVRE